LEQIVATAQDKGCSLSLPLDIAVCKGRKPATLTAQCQLNRPDTRTARANTLNEVKFPLNFGLLSKIDFAAPATTPATILKKTYMNNIRN